MIDSALTHKCDDCGRSFSRLVGLQLHRKEAHLEACNLGLPKPTGKNRPWRDDELNRLSGVELDMGTTSRINISLHDHFPHRTFGAIVSIRKSQCYRDAVGRAVELRATVDEDEGEEIIASIPDVPIVEMQLRKRLAELEYNPSPSVKAAINYSRESLMEGNATLGLNLLSREVYCQRSAPNPNISKDWWPKFVPKTRSQNRRQLYSQVQKLYKRSRKQATSVILDGAPIHTVFPNVDRTDEVFRGRFPRPSPPDGADFIHSPVGRMEIGYFSSEEISKCRDAMKKKNAPGPDKDVTMDVLLGLELPVLELLYNTWFVLKQVPGQEDTNIC